MMRWYQTSKEVVALRKHMLRVDMRVYVGEEKNLTSANDIVSSIKSIVTAAIVKGLDIIGIVSSHGPSIGWQAAEIARNQGLDIYVLAGEEYHTNDKTQLVIYGLKEVMPMNLSMEQAVQIAHQKGGFVMAINVGKRLSQHLNQIKGNPGAPDAVEVFNAVTGGFQDIPVDYPRFVSSGASSATDLESVNVFTLINRREIEGLGLLPEDEGSEYLPNYLKRDDEIQQGANPNDVSEGLGQQPQANTPVPAPQGVQ